jgi:hypothetical protein
MNIPLNPAESSEATVVLPSKENIKLWLCELTDLTPHQVEHLVEQHLVERIKQK